MSIPTKYRPDLAPSPLANALMGGGYGYLRTPEGDNKIHATVLGILGSVAGGALGTALGGRLGGRALQGRWGDVIGNMIGSTAGMEGGRYLAPKVDKMMQDRKKESALTLLAQKLASKGPCVTCRKTTCACSKQVSKLADYMKRVEAPMSSTMSAKSNEPLDAAGKAKARAYGGRKKQSQLEKLALSIPPALMTAGRNAMKGVVPGAAIGALTAEEGQGLSGALKGGVMGAGLSAGGHFAHRQMMNSKMPMAAGYRAGVRGLGQTYDRVQSAVAGASRGKMAALEKFALDPKMWLQQLRTLTGPEKMKHIQMGMNSPEIIATLQKTDPSGATMKKLHAMVNGMGNAGLGHGAKVTVQGATTPVAAPKPGATMSYAPAAKVPTVDTWNPLEGAKPVAPPPPPTPKRQFTATDLKGAYAKANLPIPLKSPAKLAAIHPTARSMGGALPQSVARPGVQSIGNTQTLELAQRDPMKLKGMDRIDAIRRQKIGSLQKLKQKLAMMPVQQAGGTPGGMIMAGMRGAGIGPKPTGILGGLDAMAQYGAGVPMRRRPNI